jgi:hypothetical protein
MYAACAARHHYERGLKLKPLEPVVSPAADRGILLHKACEEFIAGEITELPNDLVRFRPILERLKTSGAKSEVKLASNINMEPVPYDSPDAYFYGIIDTLEFAIKSAMVGDWKSGKARDYNPQLAFYTMLTFINYPEIESVKTRIRYIDLGLSTNCLDYTRGDLQRLWDNAMILVTRMNKDRIHAPTPGDYCIWCPYSKRKMNVCKW